MDNEKRKIAPISSEDELIAAAQNTPKEVMIDSSQAADDTIITDLEQNRTLADTSFSPADISGLKEDSSPKKENHVKVIVAAVVFLLVLAGGWLWASNGFNLKPGLKAYTINASDLIYSLDFYSDGVIGDSGCGSDCPAQRLLLTRPASKLVMFVAPSGSASEQPKDCGSFVFNDEKTLQTSHGMILLCTGKLNQLEGRAVGEVTIGQHNYALYFNGTDIRNFDSAKDDISEIVSSIKIIENKSRW